MQTMRAYWPVWIERLQAMKLDTVTAWLLDAGAPFALLAAQALHFLHPFHRIEQLEALTAMLEQSEETHAFIDCLRGEIRHE
ncbi:MAG: hypothetical protein Fur0043_16360 [Anaerolineales bacterium]